MRIGQRVAARATPAPFAAGDLLAGKYRVEEILGEGGMGVVVAATHVDLGKRVALKYMKLEALEGKDGIDRFMREARAAGRLRSEHVCQVHDVGRFDNGAPYIVMELLEGVDLQDIFKRVGPLAPAVVAHYVIQICDAMEEAHAAGIIHRDLKPRNLFRTRRPNGADLIKVLDFGVSKVTTEIDPIKTRTSAVIGTPAYMSPEQFSSSKAVDGRSDLWALGVIMYQLLLGRVPFKSAEFLQLGNAIINDAPEPPRAIRDDLDPGLEAIILRCLEKDREKRFATARALAAALVPFAAPVTWEAAKPGSAPSTDAVTAPVVAASPSDDRETAAPFEKSTLGLAASQIDRPEPRRTFRYGIALAIVAAIAVFSSVALIVASSSAYDLDDPAPRLPASRPAPPTPEPPAAIAAPEPAPVAVPLVPEPAPVVVAPVPPEPVPEVAPAPPAPAVKVDRTPKRHAPVTPRPVAKPAPAKPPKDEDAFAH